MAASKKKPPHRVTAPKKNTAKGSTAKKKGAEGPKKSQNVSAKQRLKPKSKATKNPSNTAARAKVNKKGSEGPKKSLYDVIDKRDGEWYSHTGSPRQPKSKNAKSQKEHLGGSRPKSTKPKTYRQEGPKKPSPRKKK